MMDPGMSNIERSELARADQGAYENEVSIGGREDLPIIYDQCKKHPGHTEFIPIQHLSMNHLPQKYRDPDILEFMKLQAVLTVGLFVSWTSSDRPTKFPNSDENYPFASLRGKPALRVGTGTVDLVHDYDESNSNKRCLCRECATSGKPKANWGKIILQTTMHVIFDNEECQKTAFEFLFDSENRDTVRTLNGTVQDVCMASDWCLVYCSTHDMELVNKLQVAQHRYLDLKGKLLDNYRLSNPNLAFIASHPHGSCKHITIGEHTSREELGPNHTRYLYNAATCPGCSGARVGLLAEYDECKWACHMHSHAMPHDTSRSGIGWY